MNIKEKKQRETHKSGKKRFEMLDCTCDTDPQCPKCKSEEAEKSIPKEDFTVKIPTFDANGKETGTTDTIVKEITVHRGSIDDCIGWSF